MSYFLIILTGLSAILTELVGLKKEGKTWSDFPNNLTIGGAIFFLLTIVFCGLSMYSFKIEQEDAVKEKNKLFRTIENQDSIIISLKEDIKDLKSTMKNYQHPIPEKFTMWVDMRFSLPNSEYEKQIENFDLFENIYIAFLFHSPNTNNKILRGKDIPNLFGIQSKDVTIGELRESDKLLIQMYNGELQFLIKNFEFTVGENNTDYTSIHDLCNKYGEFRIELYNKTDYYSEAFRINKLNLFTPERFQMEIDNIMVDGGVAVINTIDDCWK